MKKKKILIISLLAMLGTSAMAQSAAKGNFEASASIESFCQINANDINFGVVNLPLTAQSANAQMNVLCSNNTPYKVDLSYGGNYVGQSSSGTSGVSGITLSLAYENVDSPEKMKQAGYRLYQNGQPISSGQPIRADYKNDEIILNLNGEMNFGDIACSDYYQNQIYLRTVEAVKLINGTTGERGYYPDKNGLCDTVAGRINMTNFTNFFGSPAVSDKGVMTGSFKGDQLAYQITLPNDSSKPWIAGVNSYTSTGLGSNQVIEMNAKIVPSASSSSYIAQDTYIDTVTATVSY